MPEEFPFDKPQQLQWLSSASGFTRQNCGLAGYLLQLLGFSRAQ
jgi:hypothetical protein